METPEVAPDPHTMRCMEIWGGYRAVEETIATPGLDIFVFSEPYHAEARGATSITSRSAEAGSSPDSSSPTFRGTAKEWPPSRTPSAR